LTNLRIFVAAATAVVLGTLLMLLVATSTGDSRYASPTTTAPCVPEDISPNVQPLWITMSMNHIAVQSHAGVIARVERVSAPRTQANEGHCMQWRDVTLRVEKMLFATDPIDAESKTLTVRVNGDGVKNDYVQFTPYGIDTFDLNENVYHEGDTVLALLSSYKDDNEQQHVLSSIYSSMSVWRIENGLAVSNAPDRTVDAAALERRILDERAKGLLSPAAGQDVTNNPLTSF
jgi:hypothetical protein